MKLVTVISGLETGMRASVALPGGGGMETRTRQFVKEGSIDGLFSPHLVCGNLAIQQISDLHLMGGWYCIPHVQSCYEIVVMKEGIMTMLCGTTTSEVHAGEVIVIPKGTLHGLHSYEDSRMQLVGVCTLGEEYADIIRLFENEQEACVPRTCPATLTAQFDMALAEYSMGGTFRHEALFSSLVTALFNQTARLLWKGNDTENTIIRTSGLLEAICEYIQQNALEMVSCRQLSEVFSYSYPYLSKYFHEHAGSTLHEYWEYYRYLEIAHLLQDESVTITDIARRAGFSSIHTFSRAFHRLFGVSPSEYRKVTLQKRLKRRL